VRKSATEGKTAGNVDEAFKTAAKVIEAEYEWPFQSHAPMGPACAVVAINGDKVDCWSGTQRQENKAKDWEQLLRAQSNR